MPLKNYTTEISAMKSIGEIQGNLVAHGARAIMINYDATKQPESLSFIIQIKNDAIPFRLPANVAAVEKVLERQLSSSSYRSYDQEYQQQRKKKRHEQAFRVAWRILKDWVDAQMAIIETEMVTLQQVFLPYLVVKDDRTLYETMVDKGFYLAEGKG